MPGFFATDETPLPPFLSSRFFPLFFPRRLVLFFSRYGWRGLVRVSNTPQCPRLVRGPPTHDELFCDGPNSCGVLLSTKSFGAPLHLWMLPYCGICGPRFFPPSEAEDLSTHPVRPRCSCTRPEGRSRKFSFFDLTPCLSKSDRTIIPPARSFSLPSSAHQPPWLRLLRKFI